MSARKKHDLDRRLKAYFATLRPSPKDAPRRAVNWQLYAAVTGSAMAMATSASAATVGSGIRDVMAERTASVRIAKQHLTSAGMMPWMKAAKLGIAMQTSVMSQANGPVISAGGVVPLYGTQSVIQPGEWISIYGKNLATQTAEWDGTFGTSLGGTTVEINGRLAFPVFVSPSQINVQAPDDTATGLVSVVVATSAGTTGSSVTLSPFAPSFELSDGEHVSAIILRTDGLGAYGDGTYDILGTGASCLGYVTVGAKPGDSVVLFAVGFGPTTPAVPAGTAFSGAAPVNNPVGLFINGVPVEPTFVGMSSAGLYQINFIVPPGLGEGDVPIEATVGGMETQPGVLFTLQGAVPIPCDSYGGYDGSGGQGTGSGGAPFGGSGGVGSGGSGGGSGGGSARPVHGKKPYQPKLRFAPK